MAATWSRSTETTAAKKAYDAAIAKIRAEVAPIGLVRRDEARCEPPNWSPRADYRQTSDSRDVDGEGRAIHRATRC
jgi:hypothetical protein